MTDALVAADASFEQTGDKLDAITWVALALQSGKVIPPNIGRWLIKGINKFREGGRLDESLGLVGIGTADPRRRQREHGKKGNAFTKMYLLQVMGADLDEAALMVATLGEFSYHTLLDGLKRKNRDLKSQLAVDRKSCPWSLTEVLEMLGQYPNELPARMRKDEKILQTSPAAIKEKLSRRFGKPEITQEFLSKLSPDIRVQVATRFGKPRR